MPIGARPEIRDRLGSAGFYFGHRDRAIRKPHIGRSRRDRIFRRAGKRRLIEQPHGGDDYQPHGRLLVGGQDFDGLRRRHLFDGRYRGDLRDLGGGRFVFVRGSSQGYSAVAAGDFRRLHLQYDHSANSLHSFSPIVSAQNLVFLLAICQRPSHRDVRD